MSDEVAVQAAPAAVPAVLRDDATELETWAFDLSQAYGIAVRLVTTSFVPSTYSGRPEEAAAAIMTGREIGLSPLAALRSIDIINGTPAMRAVLLRALVQSAGHEVWVQEQTVSRAIVRGKRKGSDQVQESIWTIDRARELQLLSKDNWKKQPIAMLVARATSELVRLIAADVVLGIPYSVEEIEDLGLAVPASGGDAPVKRSSSTAKRRALPKKVDAVEPPLPGDAAPEAEVSAEVEEAAPVEPAEVARVAAERDEAEVAEAARRAFEEPSLEWGESS